MPFAHRIPVWSESGKPLPASSTLVASTGRFLNRDAKPNQSNPYVPWKSDPAGAMLAPMALLAMVYAGKKKRGKWDNFVITFVLLSAAGLSLSACGPVITPGPIEVTATKYIETPTPTVTVTQVSTVIASTPTSTQMPDQLNEALLRDLPEKNTYTHGKDYYAWYKQLWQNKNWWWWNSHTTFSVWDLFTVIIHIELDLVSESGSNRVGRSIEQKPHPFVFAVEITNAMRDSSSDWAQGFRLDKPYGVENISLYPDRTYFNKAVELNMIAWRSGPETGNEVIIPTGCGSYLLSGDKSNYMNNRCGNNGEWPF